MHSLRPYKDLFISYGRRESLAFVARLHRKLKLAGYDAWFDKVNIPDGEDYAARINHGIESACNFVYVMAPRAMTSPYCLLELEYARFLGKRVIPINQMVIFQCDARELSAGDRQALKNFYAFNDLPDPDIRTSLEVLERTQALIGATDWLDGKEHLDDAHCAELFAWAQGYENNWHRHEDPAYQRDLKLPLFGTRIDDLDSVVERMELVLQRHRAYVEKHTAILAAALHWQRNQSLPQHLLFGKERQQAQAWLLTEFSAGEQKPCAANDLMCGFICESRKYAERHMTDAFICYGSEDRKVRDTVVHALQQFGVTTWRHDVDIRKGVDYARAIEQGIETADNLLYLISPHAAASEYCAREVEFALQLNKRIIPILLVPTPVESLPPALRRLQYIDLSADLNNPDVSGVISALTNDRLYYQQHKDLLVRALNWLSCPQKDACLLRGQHLTNMETWLQLNAARPVCPPTESQRQLLQASREADQAHSGTEVLIAYSSKDRDFALRLKYELEQAGKSVWFDQEHIGAELDFEKELFSGIDHADNFLFVISPDSIESPYCEHEVNYAAQCGKRFIPVLWRQPPGERVPEELRDLSWLDFQTQPFDKIFPELLQAIDLDRAHVRRHTNLHQRTSEWAEQGYSKEFLLNATACEEAELWLASALQQNKQPQPTEQQKYFIRESRAALDAAQRRRRLRIFINVLLATTIMALIAAVFLYFDAETQRHRAEEKSRIAQRNESLSLAELARQKVESEQPVTAALLALEALPRQLSAVGNMGPERPLVQEARFALYNALEQQRHVIQHLDGLTHAAFSADGTRLVTASQDRTAQLWDIRESELVAVLAGHTDALEYAAFSPDSQQIVTLSWDNSARLWNRDGKLQAVLPGHSNWLLHAAYSPDSRTLVTTSADNSARLWSRDGRLLAILAGHAHVVTHAAFSPDGRRIATASQDKTVRLWDAQGNSVAVLQGHQGTVNWVAFSPDGTLLAGASADHSVRLWDAQGNSVAVLQHPKSSRQGIVSAVFSDDGRYLVSASNDGSARLWDTQGKAVAVLQGHQDALTYAAFNPDSTRIITASNDGSARLWDLEGQPITILRGHRRAVRYAEFSPTGTHIVSASSDGSARLWQSWGEPAATLGGHEDSIAQVQFDPQGRQVLSASYDHIIKLWDLYGNPLAEMQHDGALISAGFSPDGSKILSASTDTFAGLWGLDSKPLAILQGHRQSLSAANFSADGKYIVTASFDGSARLWDSRGTPLRELRGHHGAVTYALFSPDSRRIVTTSLDKSVRIWDLDGDNLQVLRGHTATVVYAVFSPDGQYLASTSLDKTARVWDKQGATAAVLEHGNWVVQAGFSPDSRHLVTASLDKTARLWGASAQVLTQLKGHTGGLNIALFSPDGSHIATASMDGEVRLWDTAGAPLAILKGHRASVTSAAFSADSKWLVTGSQDRTARIWKIFPHLQASARQNIQRPLTCREREEAFLAVSEACCQVNEKLLHDPYFGNYQGQCADGKANGKGIAQGKNTYMGDFKDGKMHGNGTYTWADGISYQGDFDNDYALELGEMPEYAQDWYRRAVQEYRGGNLDAALLPLQSQIKVIPSHAPSLVLWGQILARRGRIEEANAKYQQAQKIDGNVDISVDAWQILCRQGAFQGEGARVLSACDKALALKPGDAVLLQSRALARAQAKDWAGAAADLQAYADKTRSTWQTSVWLETLKRGGNPFTPEVLQTLREAE